MGLVSVAPRIDILIPVFRESALLESLLERLLKDTYKPKDIIVTIDEPTERSLNLVNRMKGQVKFILNSERMGKAAALNRAVKDLRGGILLFLDSDVKLKDYSRGFLKVLVEEMNGADLLDIRKGVIRRNFLSRLISYDYLIINMINWFYSKSRRSLGLNGSAFAIRRKIFEKLGGFRGVISEDLDLGMRCLLKECSFKYTDKIEVLNDVPNTWREWYTQRKRWSIGTLLWLQAYSFDILKNLMKHPIFALPFLLIFAPSIVSITLYSLTYDALYGVASILLLPFSPVLIGVALLMHGGVELLMHGTIAMLLSITGFGISTSIFKVISKKTRYLYSFGEYPAFYFIYAPILFGVALISFLQLVLRYESDIQWKI